MNEMGHGLRPEEVIGRTLLVGITYVDDAEGTVTEAQYFGVVESYDERDGMVLRLGAGEDQVRVLPPDLSALRPAPAGEYTMQSTGQVVRNPDFLALWEVRGKE